MTPEAIVYLHVLRGIAATKTVTEHDQHMAVYQAFRKSADGLRAYLPPAIADAHVTRIAAQAIGQAGGAA